MNVPYILYAELSSNKWCGVNSQLTACFLLAFFARLRDFLELKWHICKDKLFALASSIACFTDSSSDMAGHRPPEELISFP